MNTEVLWGGGELLTRSPSIDDRRQIVHADDAVAINISIRIITVPGLKNSKQVMDGDEAVTADIRAVRRAVVTTSTFAEPIAAARSLGREVA